MRRFTKLLAVLLSLTMCLSLLPVAAFAEGETDGTKEIEAQDTQDTDSNDTEDPEPNDTEDPEDDVDKEMNTPSVYDEAIQAAGDAVGAAEEAVKNAQEAADAAANEKIDAVTDTTVDFVDQQASVVDNANNVIDSAAEVAGNQAEIAANAKETVESSTTSVAEKEAAVLIAQDAAQRAAEAAQEAQSAWETANAAVTSAREAVAEAEAEYERILSEHGHDVDPEEFEAKLAEAQKKLDAAKADLGQKEAESIEAAGKAEAAGKTAEEAGKTYAEAKDAAEKISEETIEKIAGSQDAKDDLEEKTNAAKDAQDALKNFKDSTSFDDLQKDLSEASRNLNVAQNQKAAAEGNRGEQQKKVDELEGKLETAKGELGDKDAAIVKNTNDTTFYQGQLETYTGLLTNRQKELASEEATRDGYADKIHELETRKQNVTDTKTWNETSVSIGNKGTDTTQTLGKYTMAQILEASQDKTSKAYTSMLEEAKKLGYTSNGEGLSAEQKVVDSIAAALNANPQPDGYIDGLKDADEELQTIDGDLTTQKNALESVNGTITSLEEVIEGLRSTIGGINQELTNLAEQLPKLQKELEDAQTKVDQLGKDKADAEAMRDAYGELIGALVKKIEGLEGKKTDAEKALKGATDEEKRLENELSKAISNLSEALYGKVTATDVKSLLESKAKLETAVEALKDRDKKNQAKADAEEAAAKAVKAFQDATAAMAEAENALRIANDALKNASADCTLQDLAALRADLAARQARFNEVRAEFEAKQIARDQAVEDARQAAQDAQDAQDALDRIIASLPTDDAGDDTGDDAGEVDDADDTDGTDEADVTIEDEAVPLAAGPVTRAQFVDYLWRHEGSPEAAAPTFPDVPADHEFAQAIGWAQANGLVSGYEDGTFQPDELVTVKMVRTILDRFDRAFGKSVVKAAALTTLTGEDGEAVLNCDEVLAEFFGEEVVPAEDEAEIVA